MLAKKSSKITLTSLFVIALLNEISYQMVLPIIGHVVSTDLLYGSGVAIFTVTMLLASPVIGFLSDKFSRKSVLIGCMCLMLCSALLFIGSFYTHSILFFLVARGLSGIASGSTAVIQACVADISPERVRSVNFSLVGLALTIGLIVGPFLGGFFIDSDLITPNMLARPFMIIVLICLANIVLFAQSIQENNIIIKSVITKPKNNFFMLLNQNSIYLFILFFLLEFSWSLYYLTLPLVLNQIFGYHSQQIGLFLSMTGVAMCVGLIAYRYIKLYCSDIVSLKIFLSLFLISMIIIILFFNMITIYYWLILPITWSVAVSYVAIMGSLSMLTDQRHQGILMGMTLTMMALAWTITGLGAKFLFSLMNNPVPAFILSLTSLLLGVVIIMCQCSIDQKNRG